MRTSSSLLLILLAYLAPVMTLVQATVHRVTVDNKFELAVLCIQVGDTFQWDFMMFGHNIEETDQPGSCDVKANGRGDVSFRTKWTYTRQFNGADLVSYMSDIFQDCEDGMMGVIHIGYCPKTNAGIVTTTTPAVPTSTAASSPFPTSLPIDFNPFGDSNKSQNPGSGANAAEVSVFGILTIVIACSTIVL